MREVTAHSAEYIAVDALATVVRVLATPKYIIDPRSGFDPRELRDDFHAMMLRGPNENVRVVEGLVSKESLNGAIDALSVFVSEAAMRRDEDV